MQTVGIVGNVLLALAYVPQIIKLVKTKKGEDLSLLMWINYLVGDIMLAVYAYYTRDVIFGTLFSLFTVFNIIVLYLTLKYNRKKVTLLKEL